MRRREAAWGLPDASAGRVALRYVFLLRCFAIAMVVTIMLVAAKIYHVALPVPELALGTVALALYACYTAYLLQRPRPVSEGEFFWQLVVDLQLITYLLYVCGGDENPFTSLFLVPLTLAAAHLGWRHALLVTAVTLGDYAFLNFFEYLPLVMANGGAVPESVMEVAADTSYLLTASQIGFFVTRVAATSRAQAAALAALRERQLNDRLVVGFGTLAAGAAHELATPLSVIAVLVAELRAGREHVRESLDTIAREVEACKQTLRHLSQAARGGQGESAGEVPLDRFLESVADRFRMLRPDASLRTDWGVPAPAPVVRDDATLVQSVITLLNNATDASRGPVDMNGRLHDDMLILEVADRGPGIPRGLAERLGRPFVTTKGPAEGMGIGLFLAKTAVERLGGTLEFLERQGGGTQVSMILPLATLRV